MRISPDKVVQLVESEPPRIVIFHESSGVEIVFTLEEVTLLDAAIDYFKPVLILGQR